MKLIETELHTRVVVVRHESHVHGILADIETVDNIPYKIELAFPVFSSDRAGSVQQEDDVGFAR